MPAATGIALADQLKAVKSIASWERARINNVEHELRTGQRGRTLAIDEVELGGWKDRLAGLEAAVATFEALLATVNAPSLVPAPR